MNRSQRRQQGKKNKKTEQIVKDRVKGKLTEDQFEKIRSDVIIQIADVQAKKMNSVFVERFLESLKVTLRENRVGKERANKIINQAVNKMMEDLESERLSK